MRINEEVFGALAKMLDGKYPTKKDNFYSVRHWRVGKSLHKEGVFLVILDSEVGDAHGMPLFDLAWIDEVTDYPESFDAQGNLSGWEYLAREADAAEILDLIEEAAYVETPK